jgi:hypothetical protein
MMKGLKIFFTATHIPSIEDVNSVPPRALLYAFVKDDRRLPDNVLKRLDFIYFVGGGGGESSSIDWYLAFILGRLLGELTSPTNTLNHQDDIVVIADQRISASLCVFLQSHGVAAFAYSSWQDFHRSRTDASSLLSLSPQHPPGETADGGQQANGGQSDGMVSDGVD